MGIVLKKSLSAREMMQWVMWPSHKHEAWVESPNINIKEKPDVLLGICNHSAGE